MMRSFLPHFKNDLELISLKTNLVTKKSIKTESRLIFR